MQELYEKLKEYKPFDEEEAQNVKSFLQFLDAFKDNVWTRDNMVGHISSSAWVVNPEKTKVLMAYHKIYDSFAWLGGHADGDKDLLHVALKETMEESGITNVKPISNDFVDVVGMFVKPHIKRGVHIPSHIHYNVTYLLEAPEDQDLHIAEAENSAVKWIAFEDVMNCVTEEHMKPVYRRLIEKTIRLR